MQSFVWNTTQNCWFIPQRRSGTSADPICASPYRYPNGFFVEISVTWHTKPETRAVAGPSSPIKYNLSLSYSFDGERKLDDALAVTSFQRASEAGSRDAMCEFAYHDWLRCHITRDLHPYRPPSGGLIRMKITGSRFTTAKGTNNEQRAHSRSGCALFLVGVYWLMTGRWRKCTRRPPMQEYARRVCPSATGTRPSDRLRRNSPRPSVNTGITTRWKCPIEITPEKVLLTGARGIIGRPTRGPGASTSDRKQRRWRVDSPPVQLPNGARRRTGHGAATRIRKLLWVSDGKRWCRAALHQ